MMFANHSFPDPQLQAANDPIGQIGHVTPMPHERDQDLYRDNCVTPRRQRKHPRDEQKRQPPKDPDHKIDDYA